MADLQTLVTWAESVGPRYMHDRTGVHNEGRKHSYFYNRMAAGKREDEMFRHGNRLKDRISFAAQTQWRRIDPLDSHATYTRINPGKDVTGPYSVGYASIVFNEFEMDLSSAQMRPEALAHVFKDVWTQKWTDFWTGVWNGLDDEVFAVPDKTIMEVTTATSMAPMSLAALINEFANGLPAATDQPGGTWTTKQQLDPTSADVQVNGRSRWDNQRYGYNLASITDANAKLKYSTFFTQFQKLYRRCQFDRLPKKPEYSDPYKTPKVILCSLWGLSHVENGLRVSEDHFRGMGFSQDAAYPAPTFNGMPFEYISDLDSAAIFPTGLSDALGDEASTSNATHGLTTTDSDGVSKTLGYAGPRYWMPQFDKLSWVWHANHYVKEKGGWTTDRDQPWEMSKVVTALNQIWATSLACQGMLFPIADADTI